MAKKASRLRGKFKGFFFAMRLHWIFPGNKLVFLGQLSRLSRWIHRNKKKGFNDFYSYKFNYDKRLDLFAYLIEKEKLNTALDYLEFGVAAGHSFRWWAAHITDPGATFNGFDTFTGLPEDWGPFKKGDMSASNAVPEMDDARCHFHTGLFQQTLIPFLANYQSDRRRIIHMDADLYSATLYVLTTLTPYLRKGDIIMFDEFNVPMHEFKAFSEWSQAYYIKTELLGSVNNFYQSAFIITDLPVRV